MEELFKKIDAEKENRFKKPWTKLDKGSKLDRLLLFIKMQKAEHQLSDNQETQLKSLLLKLHSSNLLNKMTDIEYDSVNSTIIQIYNLSFDESDGKYSFSMNEKKSNKKSSSQSKSSNIERHFNRSKKSNNTL